MLVNIQFQNENIAVFCIERMSLCFERERLPQYQPTCDVLLINEEQITLLTFRNSTLLYFYLRRVQKGQMQVMAIIEAM